MYTVCFKESQECINPRNFPYIFQDLPHQLTQMIQLYALIKPSQLRGSSNQLLKSQLNKLIISETLNEN